MKSSKPNCLQPIVGIFGGSFDPIHNGHLGIATALIDSGNVDRIIFMPAAVAPHKIQRAGTSPEDRLAMAALAIQGFDRFEVSDYEIQRGGISYTVDTAAHFKSIYGDRLRLIIGMDSLKDLHKWYRSRELVEICGIVTYPRPGIETVREDELAAHFGPDNARCLMSGIFDGATFDVSSTVVRERLIFENFPEGLMPRAVYRYIRDKGLYRE